MKKVLEMRGTGSESFLTVMASTKASDLREIMKQYEIFGYESVIITKLDETDCVGNLLSVLNEKNKSVALTFVLKGLTELFLDAMMISLPMIASLFLVTTSMGILSKAAPQMNLLSEGLPITILVTFFLLTQLIPVMTNFFAVLFDRGFEKIATLFTSFMAGTS